MIHTYNQFMSGVDESDKMLYNYLDKRRFLKFRKRLNSIYYVDSGECIYIV